MFNRSYNPITVFYDPSIEFVIVKDYLESRGIITRLGPIGSKRLTGIVENLIRIIRRYIKKLGESVINRNRH